MESNDKPVAVVTGGAGGIGKSICGALARDGMRVVVGYNRSATGAHPPVQTRLRKLRIPAKAAAL